MTALATETTTAFCAGADTHEASEVFHVEHRGGRTGRRVELARYTVARGDQRILYGQRVDGVRQRFHIPMTVFEIDRSGHVPAPNLD